MINAEDAVFDAVYPAVSALVPDGCFQSVYVPAPSQFPFATLMEMDNLSDAKTLDSSGQERYAVVTYEANVFAMDKHECRTVMDALDTAMISLGFSRVSMQYIPNLADPDVHRLTARYRAAVNPDNCIYRHT